MIFNQLRQLCKREVVFSFRAKTVNGSVPDVGITAFSVDESGSESWQEVFSNNSQAEQYTLGAPEGSSNTLLYKIFNDSSQKIIPNLLIEAVDDPLSGIFDFQYKGELPSGVTVHLCENQSESCTPCDEVASGGECFIYVNYTPINSSSLELFNLKLGVDWLYGAGPDYLRQRKFYSIPIQTIKLEPGELLMKEARLDSSGSTIECLQTDLTSERQSFNKGGILYEELSFNIDLGEISYSSIKNGTYQYFCLKNPKTLPIKIWDDDEKWTTETVNNLSGMVEVTKTEDESLTVYIHERCLFKLKNESGQLRQLVDDDYGIVDSEEPCTGVAYYNRLRDINKVFDGVAGINYFGYEQMPPRLSRND